MRIRCQNRLKKKPLSSKPLICCSRSALFADPVRQEQAISSHTSDAAASNPNCRNTSSASCRLEGSALGGKSGMV
ncbi:hypothetical protein A7P85_09950 [Eikenella corrodens]|uniref:Uncharacterized protein n=1 Tax=Eikenella corrodens TaxID=539 RepID=A0A1A9RBY8_EIKCO|nr:hypothetical protein A7P85_09950 [Eikenella corrodens]OAM22776.1 hypothetical protein A7P92_08390 [Eikenella corrodens]